MAKKSLNNLEGLIARGEAPDAPGGFRAQTVNGTALWRGTGWNRDSRYEAPQVPEGGAWQPGRNNRTGE